MLFEIEIRARPGETDRDGARVLAAARRLGLATVRSVAAARLFLLEGGDEASARRASTLLADPVVETATVSRLPAPSPAAGANGGRDTPPTATVLFRPGVTDNVGASARAMLAECGLAFAAVGTGRRYVFNRDVADADLRRAGRRLLANEAIENVRFGPLDLTTIAVGRETPFELVTEPIRSLNPEQLLALSRRRQLSLSADELAVVQKHFIDLGRDPTDVELETIAQTWSEHCSHKTLGGRIRYRDERGTRQFEKMLKETIFAATQELRRRWGPDDWCVSVFQDNAGVVRFNERYDACVKVETHNHPSAIEPYGGANTGLGGVIRDTLGTGRGARPVCSTDVFCFAPPDLPESRLPPGVLPPRAVMEGVVAGVRDYGNRMGIPTVNGAVFFDERYLGNPLVFCGNVALLPVGMSEKRVEPGDLIVAVGGRTGRDGIHGATFSSVELSHESESISGGAVQIGNAVMEKMVVDVLLAARDRGLFTAITDCGAGGFSSAVGEMGAELGAEVWLERAPLKYQGLTYSEIWISEAQERMVLAVPPQHWDELRSLCASEGVEAAAIGEFQATGRLRLTWRGFEVGNLSMEFLHHGRPPVVREAVYSPPPSAPAVLAPRSRYDDDLRAILGSLNVASKEWIIRQYDHEVQAGSVVKPLVGVSCDGPSDAAVVRPDLASLRGIVVACGMNPRYGDLDPYWMAAGAIDEAIRNAVAVGADPARIAILDNFCWGNTSRPETLGSLVRAALACHDFALAFGTPFISGKDSLNNEFTYREQDGTVRTVAIPPSLLITAVGQLDDVRRAVTMDLKAPGNLLYQVGPTRNELGGSHLLLVRGAAGGDVPRVDGEAAAARFRALHTAIGRGLIRSCHDLSEGGLAAAVAEMAFAGEFGAALDLGPLARTWKIADDAVLLFSETNSRFVVEVAPAAVPEFLAVIGTDAVPLGRVTAADQPVSIVGSGGAVVIETPWPDLKRCWQAPLAWD